jgi:uncharacterized damage-inducible protein DinB
MTALELSLWQFDDVGRQLSACLHGLDPAHREHHAVVCAMSPLQILEHLCEVYTAYMKIARGEKHDWGTYRLADRSWDHVMSTFSALRKQARDTAALAGDDEKKLKEVSEYLILHDAYHVGQLVTSRLSAEPGWDMYAIYGEH